jgi:hypothetical protein
MARKKKGVAPESAAASEHATEGKTERKNHDLPGMVGDGVSKPIIPEIDDAASEYIRERDKRLQITPKEKAAKKKLLALMEGHGLERYDYDDQTVLVKPKDEAKTVMVIPQADYKEDGED